MRGVVVVLIWVWRSVVVGVLICPLCELLMSCIVVGVVTSLVLALILLIPPPKVWVVPPSKVVCLGVWIMVLSR